MLHASDGMILLRSFDCRSDADDDLGGIRSPALDLRQEKVPAVSHLVYRVIT
jgi:hypothetical protein